GMHTIPAIVGGTIIGALGGRDVFPTEWREWAEPLARPWQPITAVVDNRLHTESSIIHVIESLAAKTIDGQSLLYGKIRGNLLAGAIGNAMGSPVEGQFYWEIDKKHPGGIQTILEPARLESEDDNQMAALLVETYMGRDGLPVMARQFGQTWKDRLNRDHFFIQCMGHAYDLICQGWDARVTGHWIQVTGSTVMCMEPVGLYNIADPEFAAIDATAVSYMYQRGLDVMAAAMLAATVAEALRPQATVDSICQAAVRVAPTEGFKTFDKRSFESPRAYIQTCLDIAEKYDDVLAARKELYDKCLFYHQIDPLELWGLSLAMFKIAKGDVRQSAIGGTNIGRDSDTISGRAAMLSGTLRGAGGVPAEWVAMFSESSRQRIDRNAAKMTALLIEKKLPRLRRRQELAQ
ncbi:MAG TPA: ADP-ribosylglycohydrolase family protein, partial [Tepidisphaeraceae bacterium]